jgi:diguanylate cyclase (GGDEF)-like protein
VRTSDIVARYGGEEMILLLRGTGLKDALNIAEKLRKAVENTLINDQHNTYRVTVSFGVAEFKPEDNADNLIKRADEGLYKAKQQGRNRVSCVEIK